MTLMRSFQCLLCVVMFSLSSNAHAQFEVDWFTIDGGGGFASGGEFVLVGTIGQFDAGTTMSNGEFDLAGGFWAPFQTGQTVLKGDVDMDEDIDFSDIGPFIAVLQTGVFQAEADCDCNGEIEFADIPAFIGILQAQ